MSAVQPLNRDRIIGDIARAVNSDPQTIRTDISLLDQGLDSLRMVSLVETWRAEGHDIDFLELMSLSTLDQWLQVLAP